MVSKLNISLIFILLFIVNIINSSITSNGITILSFNIVNSNISWTTPNSPSSIIEMELQMNISNFYDGSISFNSKNPKPRFPITLSNIINSSSSSDSSFGEGSYFMRVCVSTQGTYGCNIEVGQEFIECNYHISFLQGNGAVSSFSYQQITNEFIDSKMYVYQNSKAPQLTGLQVKVHPVAPLVSIVLGIEYFGRGGVFSSVEIWNDTTRQSNGLQEFPYTLDGYYYIEILLSPEITGYNYNITQIVIMDIEGNTKTYNQSDIESLFGQDCIQFQLPKQNEEIDINLFTDSLNVPNNINANSFSTALVDVELSSYKYSISNPQDEGGAICPTFYLNSTYLTIFCLVPPYGRDVSEGPYLIWYQSQSQYSFHKVSLELDYKNNNQQLPMVNNITFSVPEINQLEPFYMEMNITFQTFGSMFDYITVIAQDMYSVGINALLEGNLTVGTVTMTSLIDSVDEYFNNINVEFFDSKQFSNTINFNGPNTTKRVQINDMTFIIEFNEVELDFRNYSQVSIPLKITTFTNENCNLNSVFMVWTPEYLIQDPTMYSGAANYSGLNGNVLYSNSTMTQYQTYLTVVNSGFNYIMNGDFNLGVYLYYGTTYQLFTITSQCFNIIVPSPTQTQTLITELNFYPSNIINSLDTPFITIQMEVKGDNVLAASIVLLQTYLVMELSELNYYNCDITSPYDYSTLITNFNCTIPTSNLPSQTIVFSPNLVINGIQFLYPNVLLQEFNLPSFIQVQGPIDNSKVPLIIRFSSSFNSLNNQISINYTIDENSNQFLLNDEIDFFIFNLNLPQNSIQISKNYSSVGSVTFDNLCQIDGFDYSFQSIGIYMSLSNSLSIISPYSYQFPYDILKGLDPNSQNFPINFTICDFNGPRLIEMGILQGDNVIDTSNSDTEITIYFDITDDKSGFNQLNGYIKSNGTSNYYLSSFNLNSSSIVYGNLNNARYYFNFTIPQYTIGNYKFVVVSIQDNNGNVREFLEQNTILLSPNGNSFIASSSITNNNNLPILVNITNNYQNNLNNIEISIQGNASIVSLIPISIEPVIAQITNTTNNNISTFSITNYNSPLSLSGIYYFSICLTSQSLSIHCYSSYDLNQMGILNSITIFSPITYPSTTPFTFN